MPYSTGWIWGGKGVVILTAIAGKCGHGPETELLERCGSGKISHCLVPASLH